MQISKDMLIGQLIQVDESIPPILMRAGMHCLGCPASQGESLYTALTVTHWFLRLTKFWQLKPDDSLKQCLEDPGSGDI